MDPSSRPLLSIRDLTKTFRQQRGLLFSRRIHVAHALDHVSLDVARGTTVGVVGESGSGKSTLGRCILRLIEADGGSIIWHESGGTTNVLALHGDDLRMFRRRMQVIFQDPFNSLNPARPIWQVVGEGLVVANVRAAEVRERAAAMLESVGLSRDHLDRLPHEFSGGQRQRIAIARALIIEPQFLVCDEVTSALDTRTQAQVLELLRELQARTGITTLFISHDLHTVATLSREVVVMRAGRVVETGVPEKLFGAPTQAYTRELVAAVPAAHPRQRTFRQAAGTS